MDFSSKQLAEAASQTESLPRATFVRGLEDSNSSLRKASQELFFSAAGGLALIENKIRSCFVSDAAQLKQIALYLLELGGKRVRPLLALLSARLFHMSEPSEKLIEAASGIELIHMATLLHDDIIDQSPRRRNKESAFFRYGFTPTLLAGDFLWVRAFGLCAHLGSFIVSATETACVELTEGELLEGKLGVDSPTSLEDYVQIIAKKTGSLFALATSVGAHCAGAEEGEISALRSFGLNAGIAFQMIDDILDITADENLLGKPSGTDLRQRTPSLVNILWLESKDPTAHTFFAGPPPTEAEAQSALALLKSSEIIEQARNKAREYAAKAKNELRSLNPKRVSLSVRNDLCTLLDYTLERCL